MSERLRLMGVLAHPDDESLGMGGVLARYAAEGVETSLVTATRGEKGRFRAGEERPGDVEVGRVREAELRAAARELGVSDVTVLDYVDRELADADPAEAVERIAAELRRVRPEVVVTFDPYGAYGHPDHIAICQLTTAAVVAAAGAASSPHRVSKVYYMAWSAPVWEAYQAAFKRLVTVVDGAERQARPWPEWAITTEVDTRAQWPTVWRAVQCHATQMTIYGSLAELSADHHAALWGRQQFYRAYSLVNGGPTRETDLFEGLR